MNSLNLIFTGKQQVELLREELPPLEPGCFLARTRVSLVSTGTETICYRGEMDEDSHWAGWVQYPFYPGYSNVAEILETGEGVEGLQAGDRVFTIENHRQAFTRDRGNAIKIPDGISDESAAWSKLAVITQTGVRRAELEQGSKVVIIGAGPLGQLLAQYAGVMGAKEVMVIDPVSSRLERARSHGATQVFAGSAADAVPFVEDHTGGNLADVVFDATGHYAVLPLALKLPRRFGRLILIGDSPYPSRQVLSHDVLTRQIEIFGTHNENLPPHLSQWNWQRQTEFFYGCLLQNRMRVDDLITSCHAPNDAPKVYAELLENRADTLGVLFDWSLVG